MKGKISQWNDEKGFGFIVTDDGAEKVFFHISCVKTSIRRPEVGDSVVYESMLDAQNRLKAKAVVIERTVAQAGTVSQRPQHIHIAPVRKNAFDYLLIAALLGSLAKAGLVFSQSSRVEDIIPYGLAGLVALVVLTRQKKPKEKKFGGARCKAVVDFDARTIQAWNNGFLKLYCTACHQRWLRENPPQSQRYTPTRGSGCLGMFCLLVTLPIVAGVSIYNWLS
jgi:cold shock CspA family protein